MSYITCSPTIQSVLFALLLKRMCNSSSMHIVLEGHHTRKQRDISIATYNHEELLHEYERRMGKIMLMHEDFQLWEEVKSMVNQAFMDGDQKEVLSIATKALTALLEKPQLNTHRWKRKLEKYISKSRSRIPVHTILDSSQPWPIGRYTPSRMLVIQ